MVWTVQDNYIGFPRIVDTPSTTVPQFPLGTTVRGVDNYWGGGEFILLKANGTISNGNLVVWDLSNFATACPNTANMAQPVCTALNAFSSGQYGWFQISGRAYISTTASVAAGTAFGITGAGTVGASSAGKEIENAVSVAPGTTTVVKTNVSTVNGSPVITVPGGADGWFPGVTMTGTGISGTIVSIAPDNRTVTLSANASATGIISATATYTNFIIAAIDRPFAQGRIT